MEQSGTLILEEQNAKGTETIKMVDRALAVLDVLRVERKRLGVNEIAKKCDISPSTAFRILKTLLRNPGRVFTRAQLMDHAWEEPEASLERVVDSHIKSLRSKLRAIRPKEEAIRTLRGIGYALEGDADGQQA